MNRIHPGRVVLSSKMKFTFRPFPFLFRIWHPSVGIHNQASFQRYPRLPPPHHSCSVLSYSALPCPALPPSTLHPFLQTNPAKQPSSLLLMLSISRFSLFTLTPSARSLIHTVLSSTLMRPCLTFPPSRRRIFVLLGFQPCLSTFSSVLCVCMRARV